MFAPKSFPNFIRVTQSKYRNVVLRAQYDLTAMALAFSKQEQLENSMRPHDFMFQTLKRSPAEGSGAKPPVTSGNRETSGRFSMCDFTSALTAQIFCSFMLYSCNVMSNSGLSSDYLTETVLKIYVKKEKAAIPGAGFLVYLYYTSQIK